MYNKSSLYKSWIQLIFIIQITFIVFYILLVLLGYKEFTIWSQVGDYLFHIPSNEQFQTILQLFSERHPHAMRISLIYPIFQIADILNIDVKLVYSIIVLLLFIFIYFFILSMLKKMNIRYYTSLILFFLLFLSLFMHGRITFALFGNTLILYVLFTRTYFTYKMPTIKFILYILLALWFCSVSSGTLMVALGSIILFYFLFLLIELPYIQKRYLFLFILLSSLLISFSPIIIQLVDKNLNYYDGSFIHMLDHGIGKYLVKYYYIIVIFLFLLPFILIKFINFLKYHTIFILPISMIITSSVIGLFGFSSLVSGLPAYILFLYMFLHKNILKVLN